MLVQVFHGSQVGFFELAASLLPVFLLAGIVTERVSPSRSESYSRILSHVGLIPAFALLALVAEFLSINSVATGNSVAIFRWFVCVALVASMVLVVFLLWIPWWQSLYDKDPISAKKYKRLFNWSVIPLAIIGVLLLGQGVENGVAVEGANTYEHRYERNDSAQAALRRHAQDLTVEALGVRAQIGMARAEGRSPAAISGLVKERRELKRLLGEASGEQVELSQEARRLKRELDG
ncbi:MAG: hypothetical protein ACJ75S_02620 [Solirubrobacterales bacterium]